MSKHAKTHWDEDSEYPVIEWMNEVQESATRLGYWEWVDNKAPPPFNDPNRVPDATLENMMERGGSFARSLSVCFRHADNENARRLARAFPEIIDRYSPDDTTTTAHEGS